MNSRPSLVCPRDLRPAVQWMLQELDYFVLEVGLIPAPDPQHYTHCVRAVWSRNPDWYRELCAMFPRNRRNRKSHYTDSKVKRGDVRRALVQMLREGSRSYLAEYLLSFAQQIPTGVETEVDDVSLAFGCLPPERGVIQVAQNF